MPRAINRARDRAGTVVLPTIAGPSATPSARGNPYPGHLYNGDLKPGGGNATAQAQAMPTAPPATNGKPAMPAADKPTAKAARSAAFFDDQEPNESSYGRWLLKIGLVVVCLLAGASGGWLYRGIDPPATRAEDELAQIKEALQQERDKTENLNRELATAWRVLRAQAMELADKAAHDQELIELRQAPARTERQAVADLEALAQDRRRGREEPPVARVDATQGRDHAATAVLSDIPGPARRPAPNNLAAASVLDAVPVNPDATRLIERATLLLGQGNIGTARIVLESAAEAGNAPALFALAQTYDPISLAAWGTLGTQGDVAKARELYAKAFAGGVREARDRMNALP